MNRGMAAIFRCIQGALAPLLLLAGGPALSAPREAPLEARLRAHVEVLASDDFEGREPGTEGEAKTLRYLGKQWFDIGLVSGTNDPGNEWFAPVTLVARMPHKVCNTDTRDPRSRANRVSPNASAATAASPTDRPVAPPPSSGPLAAMTPARRPSTSCWLDWAPAPR